MRASALRGGRSHIKMRENGYTVFKMRSEKLQ